MITELLSINVLIGILASGIRLATPYLPRLARLSVNVAAFSTWG